MERKIQSNGMINLLAMLLVGGAGFGLARYTHARSGTVAVVFVALGALVALLSWFQMRLEERERLEKLEFEELTRSASSSALFNRGETEVFPAQRSREQFERFLVPAFSVLLCLLQIGGGLFLWNDLSKVLAPSLVDPTVFCGLFGVFFIILYVLGKYSTGLAKLQKVRLLRPGATYLLLSAILCLVVVLTIGVGVVTMDIPLMDLYVARVLIVLLVLVGVETLINLILELYRPRVKGKVERPIYESRLVSLLGQPEGLITTARETLDYQFGFKVSDTWGFHVLEKYIGWFILAQGGILLLSTSFVFIDAGQQGVQERFGKPLTVWGPGPHLKMPWPVDDVYRYATEQIQTINVGFEQDTNPAAGRAVLWTVNHNKEENFLVANRQKANVDGIPTNANGSVPPPVSLLTVSIPVQFQITNLEQWAYINEDPVGLLEHISTSEVVRYLVSVDFQEIMSSGRWEAGVALRDRIQARADEHQMGVKIVFVGLQDIHPPSKVAPDYEKVVSARSIKEADILSATAEATRSTNQASAQAFETVAIARADRKQREVSAVAQAALFTNQIPAYLAAPAVYTHRAYLQTLTHSITNARTYLLLTTNTQDVVILNLEDKIRKDILNDLTAPVKSK